MIRQPSDLFTRPLVWARLLSVNENDHVFIVVLERILRARELAAVRLVEARALLLVVVPVVVFLYTAWLPAALADFDTFHHGEYLAAARLFQEGAFPWRDSIFIHGLLQDVFIPLAGFKLFGATAWGGLSSFFMLAGPAWWITLFLLLGYLFRGSFALMLPALAVALLRTYEAPHWRFALLPLILLALGALLHRATWPRAFLLALALLVGNVLVPELAYAVPACAVALLGFELTRYDRAQKFFANVPRTARATVAGVALAGLWAAVLIRHGAAAGFLHYYATFAPGHALSGAIPHGRGASFYFFMFLPPLLLLLAFWYCVAAVRMRRQLDVRDWVMAACAIVALLYYQKFLSRADWHILQAVSPALPLFFYAIYKLPTTCGLVGRRASALSAFILAAVAVGFAAPYMRANLERVPSNFIRIVPAQPVLAELGWSEPALAKKAAGWNQVRLFVDSVLGKGDSLFDFSNEPALYHYLLRRKPATRYYHVSMAFRRRIQLDLIEELDRARPKLVAFDSDSGLPEWDQIPNEVRHYEVSQYILRHYRPFARVAGRVFYLRNDVALDAEPPKGSFEVLRAPDAYADALACNWGYAPGFMRTESLDPGPFGDRLEPALARRLVLSGWAADARTLQPAREVMLFAHGMLVARAVPASKRPDVARALGSAALEESGFSMSQEWIDREQFRWNDLRAYAITADGKASPLSTTWPSRDDGPSDLRPDGHTSIPVVSGAASGWVDRAEAEEAERITPFEFPARTLLSDSSGLELNLDVSRNAILIVSDRPFAPAEASGARSQPAPTALLFRVAAPFSGTIRVMMDNCPQWYALSGRVLYLRYGDAVTVHRLGLLLRHRPRP